MKIVVCVKQVPLADEARIDPETKRIVREGAKALTNPFDLYAIETSRVDDLGDLGLEFCRNFRKWFGEHHGCDRCGAIF